MNDNDPTLQGPTFPILDPHGNAALLLIKSLIHGLCETAVLTTGQAVEIVDRATDVQRHKAEIADGAGAPLWQSHTLLTAIASSLRIDASLKTSMTD